MSKPLTREPTKEERLRGVASTYLMPVLSLAALAALWEAFAIFFKIPTWLLPSPSAIISEFVRWHPLLLSHTYYTFYETLLGFVFAIAVAVPISIAITYSKFLQNTIYPVVLVLQSVPKVAIAPIVLIWFGYGLIPKVIIAFLVAFFPIIVDTSTGMITVQSELLDLVRLVKATDVQIFLKIRLPHSLPYFFSSLKTAITLSVVGAVIAEFVGSDVGLGYLILSASPQLQTALAFACIFILAFMGIGLFAAVAIAEKLLIPWAFSE